jgi:hypothetical protein
MYVKDSSTGSIITTTTEQSYNETIQTYELFFTAGSNNVLYIQEVSGELGWLTIERVEMKGRKEDAAGTFDLRSLGTAIGTSTVIVKATASVGGSAVAVKTERFNLTVTSDENDPVRSTTAWPDVRGWRWALSENSLKTTSTPSRKEWMT